jgi:hypothetical protein
MVVISTADYACLRSGGAMQLIDVETLLLIFVQPIIKRPQADAELGGGGAAVAGVADEGGEDVLALDFVEGGRGGEIERRACKRWRG